MKKPVIAFLVLVAATFFVSPSAKAQPQPAPYVIMVCNINGQLYNIDQNYIIHALNGFPMGWLVSASTAAGWVAVGRGGVRYPVLSCQH
jgi:hypothetical protein